MLELRQKTVTILGLGRSGLACAQELLNAGCDLILSDSRPTEELLSLTAHLSEQRVRVEGGGHSSACLDADLIVMSPGVSVNLPIIQAAIADGVPVIGEVELAFHLRPDVPIIAITGTNGKTTTTTLIGEILASAGLKAPVGGNIGLPLVSLVHAPADWVVAEISSFQLETVRHFRPKIGVFLNFSDDHLDRHGSREQYLATKRRLFEQQRADDWVILNADDPTVAGLAGMVPARVLYFSAQRDLPAGVMIKDGWIIHRTAQGDQTVMPVNEIPLRGRHNLENVLASVCVGVILKVLAGPMRRAIAAFRGVEHRIEPVRALNGVLYVNDSKGTNYASTVKAIEAFDEPLVLIAGGRDKGGAINDFLDAVVRKVRHTILLGEAGPYFERMLHNVGYTAVSVATDLPHAVNLARAIAHSGEVVLFSPACTSFDMFKNYEERGRVYKSIVQELPR